MKDASSGRIMDYIREHSSNEYQIAVPMVGSYDDEGNYIDGSLSRLQDVGRIIIGEEDWYNTFASALINRIGKVVIQSKLYRNSLEFLKLGYMEVGDVLEEIYVGLLRARAFNPSVAEKKVFERQLPEIMAAYHKVNVRLFYKVTISYDELRGAFQTWNGIHDLVGRIIEQCYTSSNFDEFILFKLLIGRAVLDKMIYPVLVPEITKENAIDVVTEMVTQSNLLQFMSDQYNAAGVPNFTDINDQITIINAKFSALRNVNVLAAAFNMDKAQLEGKVIMIDNFGFSALEIKRLQFMADNSDAPVEFFKPFTEDEIALLNSIPALTVDRFFFIVLDQLFELKRIENGEGLYWNYWLHTWKMVDYSPFMNAIAYTTTESTAEVTALSPATASIVKGNTKQFVATVNATGLASDGVNFTLMGDKVVKSTVDSTGLVKIDPNEENERLTLYATAKSNVTSFKTSTITVTS